MLEPEDVVTELEDGSILVTDCTLALVRHKCHVRLTVPGWKSTPKSFLSSSGFLHSSLDGSSTSPFDILVLSVSDCFPECHSTDLSNGADFSSEMRTISPWKSFWGQLCSNSIFGGRFKHAPCAATRQRGFHLIHLRR